MIKYILQSRKLQTTTPLDVIWAKRKAFLVLTLKAYKGITGIAPLTLDLKRWRRLVNFTPRPLYHRKGTPVPTEQKAGWAPQPVWTVLDLNPAPEWVSYSRHLRYHYWPAAMFVATVTGNHGGIPKDLTSTLLKK